MTKQRLAFVAAGLVLVAIAALAFTQFDAHGLAILLGTGGTALALSVPPSFPARGDVDQRMHFMRIRLVVANVTAFAAGKKVGRLPSRAFVHSIMVDKRTAFNSATTDTVQLGTTAAGVDILAATDIRTASGFVNATAAAGLGNAVNNTGEVDVFMRYLQSGAVATLGDVTVLICYTPDSDQ